jgi:hypothetical protein
VKYLVFEHMLGIMSAQHAMTGILCQMNAEFTNLNDAMNSLNCGSITYRLDEIRAACGGHLITYNGLDQDNNEWFAGILVQG